MKHKKLSDALNEIRDSHITEAAAPKKKRPIRWLAAVAAVLALVILANSVSTPITATAVSLASESRARVPREYRNDAKQALKQLAPFLKDTSTTLLSDSDSNKLWSPVNAYIALAMLAEVTGSETRQQILDLFGTADMDTLRTHVNAVWEDIYQDDGKEICVLASSLWLDDDLGYHQETMDTLSYYHHASVYQSDFEDNRTEENIKSWLNENTGDFLNIPVSELQFPEETVLTLASTIYLNSKWVDEFSDQFNTTDVFHAPSGDTSCVYMNKTSDTLYYWGDSYGAVGLRLENGCCMWLILPDADKTVDTVLSEAQYLNLVTASNAEENSKFMEVKLSVPKFDVTASSDLKPVLQALGLSNVFTAGSADFSPALNSTAPIYVSSVLQSARVAIDEDGVVAASYTVIPAPTSPPPPDESIDFILDRPFLFVIEKNGLPLFTGVVNEP